MYVLKLNIFIIFIMITFVKYLYDFGQLNAVTKLIFLVAYTPYTTVIVVALSLGRVGSLIKYYNNCNCWCANCCYCILLLLIHIVVFTIVKLLLLLCVIVFAIVVVATCCVCYCFVCYCFVCYCCCCANYLYCSHC